ncbi:DHHC palmitoyltransferase-domain-containing protein [Aspergillus cavernicola]|uniref:Palmitoyltransferase n=1 Tax=Aspergillus cavernicola TaxID=176166 RepID=A0ABR4HYD8_9EURO
MAAGQQDRRINLAVARCIPPVLFGIIIYACYAITKTLCIDYLIHPTSEYTRPSRVGTGAAIIAVFYILLLFVIVTYFRLLDKVVWNPDLLPQPSVPAPEQQTTGPTTRHSQDRPRRKRKGRRKTKQSEISDKPEVDVERALDYNAAPMMLPWDTTGLESFYKKDVFVSQPDGRPIYCSKCCHYKPDRTHHCREVDRCVRKMDHFCPWVGGVVSETSFKFFIQFVFYTAVLCAYILIVCAIFTAELRRDIGDVNPHWAIGIGLSGFFGIFTFGMTLSSLQLAMYNLSTIENLSRRSVVWTLAIRVPSHVLSRLQPGSRWAPTFRTITYPLPPMPPPPPPMPAYPAAEGYQAPPPPPLPPALPLSTANGEQHVFAILQTLPGENPFDLGSPLKNLQQVLGFSIIDWFLPFKHSPCADHSSLESESALGPVVSRLKREAGLESTPPAQSNEPAPTDHRPKRKRRRREHRRPE